MKKIVIILLVGLAALSSSALAITQSGSVDIGATISGGGPPPGCPPHCPPPLDTLAINQVSSAGFCTSATVAWHTYLNPGGGGAASTGYVTYWPQGDSGNKLKAEDNVAAENHAVNLSGLNPLTTYDFTIDANAAAGHAFVGTLQFTTACQISNAALSATPSERGVRIDVTYPDDSDISRVIIRKALGAPPSSQTEGEEFYSDNGSRQPLEQESFFDPHIAGDTHQRDYGQHTAKDQSYCYTVFICNSYNICSSGAFDCAQRTVPEASNVLAASGNGWVNLSWTNPASDSGRDFTFTAARLVRTDNSCQANGELLREDNFSSWRDDQLENNQTYYYKVLIKNAYGEYSVGSCLFAKPTVAAQTRCFTGVDAQAGDRQIAVSWVNPISEPGVFTFNDVLWRRSGACVNNPSEGNGVYQGTGQNFIDSVANKIVYFYSGFVNYNNNQVVNCGCISAMADTAQKPPPLCPDCVSSDQIPPFKFFVNGGALEIFSVQGKLKILAGYNLKVAVERQSLEKEVALVVAQLGSNNYFLTLDGRQENYQTEFKVPIEVKEYPLQLVTIYTDKTQAIYELFLQVVPWGYVYDTADNRRIPAAEISLWRADQLVAGFGLANPQDGNEQGEYGLMAPSGNYRLKVSKNNYQEKWLEVMVADNIINSNVGLLKAKNLRNFLLDMALPAARKAVVYLAPALAALALINVIVGVPWWSFAHYLQYLFTEPLAWLFRRRKKGWGVVYNSVTKKPVDLAVVRLYDFNGKKLLRSRVTNKEGRYNFLVEEGNYYLEVVKPGFVFPSVILVNTEHDHGFTDIYHGQEIKIKAGQQGLIAANIPLDQEIEELSDKQVIGRDWWRGIRENVSIVSPILAVVSFILSPVLIIGLLTSLHLVLYLFFKRLARRSKAKPWGLVFDLAKKKSLPKAVVRIFSSQYNRMLEAQVTDGYGRYGFLVDNNLYYLTASKDGYVAQKTENIDLNNKRAEEVIDQNIGLVSSQETKPVENNLQNIEIQTTENSVQTTNQSEPTQKEASEAESKTADIHRAEESISVVSLENKNAAVDKPIEEHSADNQAETDKLDG